MYPLVFVILVKESIFTALTNFQPRLKVKMSAQGNGKNAGYEILSDINLHPGA